MQSVGTLIRRPTSIDYMQGFRVANGYPMIRAVFDNEGADCKMMRPLIGAGDILKSYFEYSANQMKKIQDKIDAITPDENIVVWGASFQLERLIAYTNLLDKNIAAIVDNSKTKHGLYLNTKSKVIRVVSPDEIPENDIDAVIITSWNNIEPIKKQIIKMGLGDKIVPIYDM